MTSISFPNRPLSTEYIRELCEDGFEAYSVVMFKDRTVRSVVGIDIRYDGEDVVFVLEDGGWRPILGERADPERVLKVVQAWIESREAENLTPIRPEPWSGDSE